MKEGVEVVERIDKKKKFYNETNSHNQNKKKRDFSVLIVNQLDSQQYQNYEIK